MRNAIPAEALPTRRPGERVAEYRRRSSSRYVCVCEACCAAQPWRLTYRTWNAGRLLKMGAMRDL